MTVERVCVIDLGTNSFHALIFELRPDRVPTVVDRLKETVALGNESLTARVLTHDAVRRAEGALARIKTLAERRGVSRIKAYATSAIREASNGEEFIAHVRRRVSLDIRPIPGELEAELIYLGVREHVDLSEPSMVIDIGGGSTEIVVGDRSSLHYATSLKLGAARLTASFVRTDPLSDENRAALEEAIELQLAPALSAAREHGVRQLVGCSGTMENLGEVAHRRSGRDGTVFQHALAPGELMAVFDELLRSSHKDREAMHAIDAHRVDQIVAGAVLLRGILEAADIERVVLSPAALREGMVVELMRERGEELVRLLEEPDLDRRRCLELGNRHRFDEPHARHVARLADQLFEALAPLHQLDERARRILDRASLVHDIGHAVSGRRHHKHTRYLIQHAEWPGTDPEEVELVGAVARYHRRAVPRKKHERYKRLNKKSRRMVEELSAILRLANALDRTHVQNTRDLKIMLTADSVHVTITTRSDPDLELMAAARASEHFERAFGRSLEVLAAWNP